MRRDRGLARLAGLLAAMALIGPVAAQDMIEGGALFARNCAACHGADASGNGPLAPVLILQPSDLTRLAAENGGSFPMRRVIARIDGRDPLVAHGSPMPVFGPYFEGDRSVGLKLESGQPALVSAAVADLIAWLLAQQQ